MASALFSLGIVNITGHLIINARKVTDPLVVVASQTFAPPHSTTRNVTFNNLPLGTYYFDFRDSPDGIGIGTLLATYNVILESDTESVENVFYTVDGTGDYDPDSEGDTITDPYLDGKNVIGVFKEGFRFLKPFSEWERPTSDSVHIIGATFGSQEVFMVQILNRIPLDADTSGAGGGFDGVTEITANITLTSTHVNKKLRCKSLTARLVITLPVLATIAEGGFFHFTTYSGSQIQTKIVTQSGQVITGYGTELTLGAKEFLKIERRGSLYEVIDAHANIDMVWQHFGDQTERLNALPENGALYDGDDYPRPWNHFNTVIPTDRKIVDDNVTNPSYVHPVGKEGMVVVHSTLKKFRMPNTQGHFYRNLPSFTDFSNGLPGRKEDQMVGPHNHPVKPPDSNSDAGFGKTATGGQGAESTGIATYNTQNNSGTETRPINIGEISLRRI